MEQIYNTFKIINKLLLTLNVKKKIKVYPHLQRILLTEFKNSDFMVYVEKRFAIKQVGLGSFAIFLCLFVYIVYFGMEEIGWVGCLGALPRWWGRGSVWPPPLVHGCSEYPLLVSLIYGNASRKLSCTQTMRFI